MHCRKFPGLKVIARASSFQFRNSKERSPSSAGSSASRICSKERAARRDAVRISAELISVKDGTAIWSEHYDRPYKDLFKLQDEITNAVATSLKVETRLGGSTRPASQSERPPSGNLDATTFIWRASFYSHRQRSKISARPSWLSTRPSSSTPTMPPPGKAEYRGLNVVLNSGSSAALTQVLRKRASTPKRRSPCAGPRAWRTTALAMCSTTNPIGPAQRRNFAGPRNWRLAWPALKQIWPT